MPDVWEKKMRGESGLRMPSLPRGCIGVAKLRFHVHKFGQVLESPKNSRRLKIGGVTCGVIFIDLGKAFRNDFELMPPPAIHLGGISAPSLGPVVDFR